MTTLWNDAHGLVIVELDKDDLGDITVGLKAGAARRLSKAYREYQGSRERSGQASTGPLISLRDYVELMRKD